MGLIPLMLRPSPAPSPSSTSPTTGHRTPSPTMALFKQPSSASFPAPPSQSPSSSPSATRFTSSSISLHFRSASTSALPAAHRFPTPPNRRSNRRTSTRLSTIAEPSDGSVHDTMRRVSLPPLPPMPTSPADWSQALAVLKREFFNRRFRQCAARCNDILDRPGRGAPAQPVHLIYIRFYAAASLEQMARGMYATCPARTRLLQQARAHYAAAEDLARDETVPTHSPSSRRSSAGSYSGYSTSSRTTASTALSSPTNSIYGPCDPAAVALEQALKTARPLSNDSTASCAPPSKKRVTFLDEDEEEGGIETFSYDIEPIVRPDSPTLGFDEWICPSPSTKRPSCATTPTLAHQDLSQNLHTLLLPQNTPQSRLAALLADVCVQMASHVSAVDQALEPARSPMVSLLEQDGEDGQAVNEDGVRTSEMARLVDIQARIEKLRLSGWARPRFNPEQYRALRDSVLGEM